MPKELSTSDTGEPKKTDSGRSKSGDQANLEEFHREATRTTEAYNLQSGRQKSTKLDSETAKRIVEAFTEKHNKRVEEIGTIDNVSVHTSDKKSDLMEEPRDLISSPAIDPVEVSMAKPYCYDDKKVEVAANTLIDDYNTDMEFQFFFRSLKQDSQSYEDTQIHEELSRLEGNIIDYRRNEGIRNQYLNRMDIEHSLKSLLQCAQRHAESDNDVILDLHQFLSQFDLYSNE